MKWKHVKMIILPPVDGHVLKPDGSKSCLFLTPVYLMQNVIDSFAHYCPLVLHRLSGWPMLVTHMGQRHNFHRELGKVISSTVSVQKSPSSKALDPWPSAQCVDTWYGNTRGHALKSPGGFSLHQLQQPPPNIYSYFVLNQANNFWR